MDITPVTQSGLSQNPGEGQDRAVLALARRPGTVMKPQLAPTRSPMIGTTADRLGKCCSKWTDLDVLNSTRCRCPAFRRLSDLPERQSLEHMEVDHLALFRWELPNRA